MQQPEQHVSLAWSSNSITKSLHCSNAQNIALHDMHRTLFALTSALSEDVQSSCCPPPFAVLLP